MTSKEDAERDLTQWAAVNRDRDRRVHAAHAAGISKNAIHIITGISRVTIDRILAKEPAMSVSIHGWTPEFPRELLDALNAANIDTDSLDQTPDGVWSLQTPGGGRVAFGEDGTDDEGVDWWMATVYDEDDANIGTINTTSLTDLAAQMARWDVPRVVTA